MKLEVELTKAQAVKLQDMVCDYQDMGPDGAGWQSDVAGQVAAIVDNAIEQLLNEGTKL